MYNLTRIRCHQAGRVLLSLRLVTPLLISLLTLNATNAFASSQKQSLAQLDHGRSGAALVHANGALYLIGGETENGTTGRIEKLDLRTKKWSTVTERAMPRKHHAAVAQGDKIYIIGGRDKDGAIGDVEILDTKTNMLSDAKPMPTPRYFVAATSYRGEIYVAGGTHGWGRVANVEVYSPEDNKWFIGPSLKRARDTQLVVLGKRLFALGGYAGKDKGVVSDIEMYTPQAWRRVGEMPKSMSSYATAVINNRAYFFGDHKKLNTLSGLRKATLRKASFDEAFPAGTFTPRKHASAVSVAGRIVVVGGVGKDGKKSTAVELFSVPQNTRSN